ncbi:uncharacterized protein G2W53_037230 [Senna tora]|uniref:Uncharacterized protein n=1 Tax=Senna tora TaxID=362788 RepID=A0A834W5W5_9FABA|nr:uncharacterized protein G2W53_037230 [Senna tora]
MAMVRRSRAVGRSPNFRRLD